ncbi:uncharacterized [Tachysurus ichikawai]
MKAIKCRQIHPSPAHLISLPEFSPLHSRMERANKEGTEKPSFSWDHFSAECFGVLRVTAFVNSKVESSSSSSLSSMRWLWGAD